MNIFLAVVCYILFLIMRLIINILYILLLKMNGTREQIKQKRKNYDTSAQVLKIIFRYKLDRIMAANKLADFVTVHERFENPSYVLRDEVTLYCIDDDNAVFVENSKGSSPWDVMKYSFSRSGQYQEATKVIIMPLSSAYRVAQDIGLTQGNVILLPNTSRCGSTWVCQMFHALGIVRVYSEPSVLNDVLQFIGRRDNEWISDHVKIIISLMCKSHKEEVKYHLIKPTVLALEIMPMIFDIFPNVPTLFLYRSFVPAAQSVIKLIQSRPYFLSAGLISVISESLFTRYHTYHRLMSPCGAPLQLKSKSNYIRMTYGILLSFMFHEKWTKEGRAMAAVRYEHLLLQPVELFSKILEYVGVDVEDKEVLNAMKTLDKDSQMNTDVSRSKLSQYSSPEFTDTEILEIRQICTKNSIPDVFTNRDLQNTIIV